MRRTFVTMLVFLAAACAESDKKETKDPAPHSAPISENKPAIDVSPKQAVTPTFQLAELARTENKSAVEELTRLVYGTAEERKWASFGLGLNCRQYESARVLSTLTSATATWASKNDAPSPELLKIAGFSIGSCATPEAEQLLSAWLNPDPSVKMEALIDAGAFGLAALVDHGRDLSERTQTALLDAAAREKRAELLLPLSRMNRLSDAVGAHLLEVVDALLAQKISDGRRHALLALGRAGSSAVEPLTQIFLSDSFSPQERAGAAQSLARIGRDGQQALDQSIAKILEHGLPLSFDRDLWIPLRAALEELESADISRPFLAKINTTVLSEGDSPAKVAQRRRLIWLRCRAADLLAETRFDDKSLLACDPDHGVPQKLAELRVLGRGALEGKRLAAFLENTKSADPVVVQAALRLIPAHPELKNSAQVLSQALESQVAGTQATAAQIISAYPARVLADDKEGAPDSVVNALERILTTDLSQNPPVPAAPSETRAAAIRAIGALRVLSLKPKIEQLCDGKVAAFWEPAAQALALLGNPKRKCPEQKSASTALPLAQALVPPVIPEATTLVIDSDVGELLLHLEPEDAPIASAHLLRLVESGFYNGISVHGGKLGFAVQFGDKNADGFDDEWHEPLPHEVSPTPFSSFDFGFGTFAPSAHFSQLFVVTSDAPQLTGARVRLGRAEGPWQLLVAGDVFHSVKRRADAK